MNEVKDINFNKKKFNKVFFVEDKETGMYIDILSNGKTYFTKLKLLDGTLIESKFNNSNENYRPTIRDLVRDKITFSSKETIKDLASSLIKEINDHESSLDNHAGALEVANNCIDFLVDFPMEQLSDYTRETRKEVNDLVFANSVLSNEKVLGPSDREFIVGLIKLNPARFKFPENIAQCLKLLGTKAELLIKNKY